MKRRNFLRACFGLPLALLGVKAAPIKAETCDCLQDIAPKPYEVWIHTSTSIDASCSVFPMPEGTWHFVEVECPE